MSDKLMPHFRLLIWLVLPVLLLLLQYRIWLDDSGVVASRQLQQRIALLREDNEVQQSENDALLAEVEDLRHGQTLLEEKAREDLGLVRDGETFILFVDPPAGKQ
ncbi:septum formation initiator family protein [Thalassolituus sp. ST750PaO-4]|uniref:FtsB family cell division protein n=1 Tax=Thalassolituus sp. ST750PaO-4 TaxID=2742965 RepID=UPI000C5F90E1|nr:septum formation initiator family protein [Thalassolituus sp. ST750PaO-4]MCA6061402.1 septum formation initiator family protein [Thalassolituus sp. ST750PaO-4]PIQ39786.1 MAG: cell division protein FtsB [Thalassolituus sp. CG17_big_fil_post_rev_8_21_14_2_50_53_8]